MNYAGEIFEFYWVRLPAHEQGAFGDSRGVYFDLIKGDAEKPIPEQIRRCAQACYVLAMRHTLPGDEDAHERLYWLTRRAETHYRRLWLVNGPHKAGGAK